jgi:diphthamide synthase subunit DPH2
MIDFKARLAHERACRDAFVKCGNKPPDKPDPEDKVIYVPVVKFDGRIYDAHLKETGHNHINFKICMCSKKQNNTKEKS